MYTGNAKTRAASTEGTTRKSGPGGGAGTSGTGATGAHRGSAELMHLGGAAGAQAGVQHSGTGPSSRTPSLEGGGRGGTTGTARRRTRVSGGGSIGSGLMRGQSLDHVTRDLLPHNTRDAGASSGDQRGGGSSGGGGGPGDLIGQMSSTSTSEHKYGDTTTVTSSERGGAASTFGGGGGSAFGQTPSYPFSNL